MGQVYENKGITEKAIAEYEKFIRIHETGAMVDEATSRFARLKNIPVGEVEALLNIKKQDAAAAKTAEIKAEADAVAAAQPSVPHAGAAAGIKMTDPKEYLRQVLAKAKAAKAGAAAAATPAPAEAVQPTTSAAPAAPPAPKTPVAPPPIPPLPKAVSAAPVAPVSIPVPKPIPPPLMPSIPVPIAPIPPIQPVPNAPPVPTVKPAPAQPPVPDVTSAPTEVMPPEPPPAESLPIPEEEVSQPPVVESVPFVEEEAAIPAFSLDAPLPASALDGYVLDEDEVFNAITQYDTNSIEAESEILEAMEVLSGPVMPAAPSNETPAPIAVQETVIPPEPQKVIPKPPPPVPTAPEPAPAAPAPVQPAPAPPEAATPAPKSSKSKNTIKHGFDF